jgi:transcriptional regulator with XRE-family HTH domain
VAAPTTAAEPVCATDSIDRSGACSAQKVLAASQAPLGSSERTLTDRLVGYQPKISLEVHPQLLAAPRQEVRRLRTVAPPTVHAEALRHPPGGFTPEVDPLPSSSAHAMAGPFAAAIAVPRLVNPVAIAVEFGRSGHGWAGGLVYSLWLRRRLRERRISQRQLATMSGVNHSTISRLLRDNRSPSLETATKLAHALRLSASEAEIAAYFDLMVDQSPLPTQRVESALRGDEDLEENDVRELMDAYLRTRSRRRRARRASDPATRLRRVD